MLLCYVAVVGYVVSAGTVSPWFQLTSRLLLIMAYDDDDDDNDENANDDDDK